MNFRVTRSLNPEPESGINRSSLYVLVTRPLSHTHTHTPTHTHTRTHTHTHTHTHSLTLRYVYTHPPPPTHSPNTHPPNYSPTRTHQRIPHHAYTNMHTHTRIQAEFDYLKSLEIEEKINCLRWATPINSAFQAYYFFFCAAHQFRR
jgi:hypothetical protein